MAEIEAGAYEFRIALHGHGHAEHGQRQAALLELAENAPGADPRAVLVDRLHAHVPCRVRGRADDFGEELLAAGVAMQHAVLAALLEVEHELHGDARATGPVGKGRIATVAEEIARILGRRRHALAQPHAAGCRRPVSRPRPGLGKHRIESGRTGDRGTPVICRPARRLPRPNRIRWRKYRPAVTADRSVASCAGACRSAPHTRWRWPARSAARQARRYRRGRLRSGSPGRDDRGMSRMRSILYWLKLRGTRSTVLERHLPPERRRHAVHDAALHLRFDRVGIDRAAAVDHAGTLPDLDRRRGTRRRSRRPARRHCRSWRGRRCRGRDLHGGGVSQPPAPPRRSARPANGRRWRAAGAGNRADRRRRSARARRSRSRP